MILGGRINSQTFKKSVVASPLHPKKRPGILSSHRSNVGTRGRSLDHFKRRVSFDGTEAGPLERDVFSSAKDMLGWILKVFYRYEV